MNGKAAAVLQDAEAYQHLLNLAAEASAAEGIRHGMDDLTNGRTQSACDIFDELRVEARARKWQDENGGALRDANTFLDHHRLWSDGKRVF